MKVMDIPFGKFRDKGVPIDNISNFNGEKEHVVAAASQTSLNLYRMIFVTRQAMMKIVDGGEFDVAKRTVAATKLSEDDEVVSVEVLNDQKQIILQSQAGYFLKFNVDEIPEKKKNAIGVRGMRFTGTDYVEGVYYTRVGEEQAITYREKSVDLHKLKLAKRDGKGTKIRV